MPEIPDLSRLDQREETRRRIHHLVDKSLFHNDATYRATVAMFERWLAQTEMALRDEDIDESTIRRVLDRMIFGTPYGDSTSAYERMAKLAVDTKLFRQERFGEHRTPGGVLKHLGLLGDAEPDG